MCHSPFHGIRACILLQSHWRRTGLFVLMQAKRTSNELTTERTGTVRFQKIVATAGKPSLHLLWMDPAKDPVLQKAVQAFRVMTLHQRPFGAKTDFGTIGFEKNVAGQVLIFPKSLKPFAGKRVVGVKYDSIVWAAASEGQPASPETRPPKAAGKSKPEAAKAPAEKRKRPVAEENAPGVVVKFPPPRPDDEDQRQESLEEIKDQVRHAMKFLEEGKQVAAFNLLKRIVE